SVLNTAAVSGGGEVNATNNSASDPTSIGQTPDLTISKSHSGSFRQGDAGASYTLIVKNTGDGPTVGVVMLTDTIPVGLTPTVGAGTISGWSVVTTGQTVTATRSDVLASGGSYPALTIPVNVANNAPATVTNTATVSGGGQINTANDSASDPTVIGQAA